MTWHDGPEWTARDVAVKQAETARLAALVPEPATRGAPRPGLLPDVPVDVPAYDVWCVQTPLGQEHRDLQVRVIGGQVRDAAVRTEPWTHDQLRRARVRLRRPVAVAPGTVGQIVAQLTEAGLGEVVPWAGGKGVGAGCSTRALGRSRGWEGLDDDDVGRAFDRAHVEVAILPT